MDLKIRNIIFFTIAHLTSIYGIYLWINSTHFWKITFELFVLYFITGILGITAGAHRLWSHQSYKAKWPARLLMMLANSMSNQLCIYNWVKVHRTHHAYADSDADPHNINKGFFYAHMGWLLTRTPDTVKEKYKLINLNDLHKDPIVMFQYKLDPWWNAFWCFIVPGIYTYLIYNDFILGYILHGVTRWIIVLHITWTINSVAHTFGTRKYNPNIRAADSLVESFLSGGEGTHNYHHHYPRDYAASEFSNIFHLQWNPTKYWIDFLYIIGQASDRKRYNIQI